jgi:hypothetical protein
MTDDHGGEWHPAPELDLIFVTLGMVVACLFTWLWR